ncbi:hypothetical protein EVAR_14596_1 [Eumeta japonica]|uniref:Uncharacterized protein n=1 Tax=Eumeta variegata TaxID=151549 RepID=A0A4C1UUG3_EUMVA|nr:hypothetical protein EVAR_14596_1 [Eumeta japonica]
MEFDGTTKRNTAHLHSGVASTAFSYATTASSVSLSHCSRSLYHERHSTDVVFGRRRRRTTTLIFSQISATTFGFVEQGINSESNPITMGAKATLLTAIATVLTTRTNPERSKQEVCWRAQRSAAALLGTKIENRQRPRGTLSERFLFARPSRARGPFALFWAREREGR